MEKEKIIDALRRAIYILKMLGYAGGDLDYFETVLEGAKNTEQQVQADEPDEYGSELGGDS